MGPRLFPEFQNVFLGLTETAGSLTIVHNAGPHDQCFLDTRGDSAVPQTWRSALVLVGAKEQDRPVYRSLLQHLPDQKVSHLPINCFPRSEDVV